MNPQLKGNMSLKHGYDAEIIMAAVRHKVEDMDIQSLVDEVVDQEVSFYLGKADQEDIKMLLEDFGTKDDWYYDDDDSKKEEGTSSASEIATPKP
jgi:hypothetical protein